MHIIICFSGQKPKFFPFQITRSVTMTSTCQISSFMSFPKTLFKQRTAPLCTRPIDWTTGQEKSSKHLLGKVELCRVDVAARKNCILLSNIFFITNEFSQTRRVASIIETYDFLVYSPRTFKLVYIQYLQPWKIPFFFKFHLRVKKTIL